jgi:outer membrane protein assembly factor BamA
MRMDPYTGPLGGRSLMAEFGGGYLPGRSAVHGFARFDANSTWQIIGRANFSLRASAASSFAPDDTGRSWARSWWLSSADNLRGYYPLDTAYLVGLHYYVANAELQVPFNNIIRFLFFEYVEGVAALDFGGVFNNWTNKEQRVCADTPPGFTPTCNLVLTEPGAWESRTLTGVLGTNILFGPLLFRLHFGHPFDIGGQETPAQRNNDSWVTNITLRYFFF